MPESRSQCYSMVPIIKARTRPLTRVPKTTSNRSDRLLGRLVVLVVPLDAPRHRAGQQRVAIAHGQRRRLPGSRRGDSRSLRDCLHRNNDPLRRLGSLTLSVDVGANSVVESGGRSGTRLLDEHECTLEGQIRAWRDFGVASSFGWRHRDRSCSALGRPKIMLGSRSVVRQFVPSRCEKRLSAHLPANSRFLNRAQPRDRPLIENPTVSSPVFHSRLFKPTDVQFVWQGPYLEPRTFRLAS